MRKFGIGLVGMLCALMLALPIGLQAQNFWQQRYPKREFRAAWIQTVNGQFKGMTTERMKAVLTGQLDTLREAGINAGGGHHCRHLSGASRG